MSIPKGFVKIGSFGVDAGLVWIGDPCYILHKGDESPKELGKDWSEFCDRYFKQSQDKGGAQFGDCLGVCIMSGYGDGVYDVYIKKGADGYTQQALIDFVGSADEEE